MRGDAAVAGAEGARAAPQALNFGLSSHPRGVLQFGPSWFSLTLWRRPQNHVVEMARGETGYKAMAMASWSPWWPPQCF